MNLKKYLHKQKKPKWDDINKEKYEKRFTVSMSKDMLWLLNQLQKGELYFGGTHEILYNHLNSDEKYVFKYLKKLVENKSHKRFYYNKQLDESYLLINAILMLHFHQYVNYANLSKPITVKNLFRTKKYYIIEFNWKNTAEMQEYNVVLREEKYYG